jgi:hypothetical protein
MRVKCLHRYIYIYIYGRISEAGIARKFQGRGVCKSEHLQLMPAGNNKQWASLFVTGLSPGGAALNMLSSVFLVLW